MDLRKFGIRYGLIAGGLTLVIYLAAYLIDKRMFVQSTAIWLGTFVVYLWAMRQASIETRNAFFQTAEEENPSWRFSHAIQAPFMVFLIAQVIYAFFQFAMVRFVDPGLVELTREIAMEELDKADSWTARFLNEEALDMAREAIESQDFTPTVSNALLGLAFSLLGGFILSAIFGLIYRRETSNPFGKEEEL